MSVPQSHIDVAVIDSGGANIASVLFAFERLERRAVLTADPDVIAKAPHVLLPGVGAAADAMKTLEMHDGLIDCIENLTQPVLGICLGMQLLYDFSEEGHVDMLGVINGEVKHFPDRKGLPVPHMGWNHLIGQSDHPLLLGLMDKPYFYFVHSYRAETTQHTIGGTQYGESFTAICAKDNFMGCQFHPERSGVAGHTILDNFLNL